MPANTLSPVTTARVRKGLLLPPCGGILKTLAFKVEFEEKTMHETESPVFADASDDRNLDRLDTRLNVAKCSTYTLGFLLGLQGTNPSYIVPPR